MDSAYSLPALSEADPVRGRIRLWHGSRGRFDAFVERDPLTRLHAFWATDDPLLAALYAGPEGWVLPVGLADGADMLDASGWPGIRGLHPIDAGLHGRLMAAAEDIGFVFDDDEKLGGTGRTLNFALRPGFGGHGRLPDEPCWEGLVQDDQHDNENLNALLQTAGYGAVLCVDPLPGILGDIERRLAHVVIERHHAAGGGRLGMGHADWLRQEVGTPEGEAMRPFLAEMEALRRRGDQPLAVAFLDPAAASISAHAAVPARQVMNAPAAFRRQRTDLDDLCRICVPCDAARWTGPGPGPGPGRQGW